MSTQATLPLESSNWPLESSNWRPLHPNAITFVCRRLRSVRTTEIKLKAALDSGDLPSILEKEIGGRAVREPLMCWEKIVFKLLYSNDLPGKFSGSNDDIEIALDNELLDPHSIFVWGPYLERLCELTDVQPKPARNAPKRAATSETRTERLRWKITYAIWDDLHHDRTRKYVGVTVADLERQLTPAKWKAGCEKEGVSPKEVEPPKRDAIAKKVGRRPKKK